MSEPAEIVELADQPKAKKKRKYTRRKKREAKVVQFKKPDEEEFAGLTPQNCCNKCRPDSCFIWDGPQCAHPMKSAMPSPIMSDPQAFARYQRARKYLDHLKIEARG